MNASCKTVVQRLNGSTAAVVCVCVQLSEAHNLQAEVGDGWNGSKSQGKKGDVQRWKKWNRHPQKGHPKVKFKLHSRSLT